ncbi:MAG: methyltransferase domain-containing protein [Bacteroidales bacterium]|nr:methyltransferase domain-containing protein [Bacteroidales bacterium]
MTDWKKFWQGYRPINNYGDADLLYQVGKTVGRKAIDSKLFMIMVEEIESSLSLNSDDNLLDLCCGNGVLTYELAKSVNSVVGVDFSRTLIENAKTFKCRDNILYVEHDVKQIPKISKTLNEIEINKVLLYDGLAYFTKNELNSLINFIGEFRPPDLKFLIGSVLDSNKKWGFFNTFYRKMNYVIFRFLVEKRKGLGAWWDMKHIAEICESNAFKYTFIEQNTLLHTAHYRTDIIIYK